MARKRRADEPARDDEILVNLNARVPRDLWRRVRLQCTRENRLLRSFITEALEERLRGEKRKRA